MLCSHYRLLAVLFYLLVLGVAFGSESHAKAGVVFVNGVPVLEIKSDDHTALVNAIVKVLRLASADDVVDVASDGNGKTIKVGSTTAVTVTLEEAAKHDTTVSHLAELWSNSIRDALSLPSLKFPDDSYRLPVGTSKSISLVGSLSLNAVITSSNEAAVTVKRTDSGVDIRCVGVGDAQLIAESGNATRSLNIFVRPYAATFPQTLSVEVVGDPANGSAVSSAIEGALKSRLPRVPSAHINFSPIQGEALGLGKSKNYDVWVRARAQESFDGVGVVSVSVKNVAISKNLDTELWYSNSPESVMQVGPLFTSFLKPDQSVRFLYHHINAATQPLIFRVEAINDSEQTARIVVCTADCKPDKNPVVAGMSVANQFLKYWLTGTGEVVSIPPHTTLPISFRRLSPKETTSGLCTLRLLNGPKEVQVRAEALPPFDLDEQWYNATFSSTPWHEVGTHPVDDYDRGSYEPSDHVYPNPYKDEEINYEVGGRFGSLMIGQKPIAGEDHSSNLDGNYGVLYTIKAHLSNPNPAPADIEMDFESSAGYTGGLFIIDGTIVQTPYLGPKGHSRVTKFHLPPGASRTVEIETLPISGGAYPATITIRPLETQ
jgi:hypothetical protein